MRNVRHLLEAKSPEVYAIAPDAPMIDAIRLMAEKRVGALLVLDNGRLAGIISERDYARKIILQGRDEAELTLKTARAKAEKLVSQEEVYQQAQHEAQEIIAQAQKSAKELKNATVEYCENILSRTAENLAKSASAIEETRKSVRKQKND